jgi:CCR4-NOT transcription complex subunit 3
MAHRKLQQEIDRVFKKINEGLDIFNTYHERHENAPNPSQKEKLENDLKREVKKLQKLREQIKVWQAQSEVKDKEKLLEYRRMVEVAMEKYKVVEKGSKVKAYSNMSLKAAGELDPEEREKVETIQFIQDSIDELEHQYETVDVEIEKLTGKKSKKSSGSSAQKEELKEIQQKYRWHQQQLELALRLLENGELEVTDIQEIKEELEYFLQNNRSPDFIDNEYIYESLDLESNEVLQHEIVTSFNGIVEKDEKTSSPSPPPKKEQSPEKKVVPSIPSHTTQPMVSQPISTPKLKKVVTLASSTHSPLPSPSLTVPSISNTLKPATTPKQELKWSSLVAGLNKKEDEETVEQKAEKVENVEPSLVAEQEEAMDNTPTEREVTPIDDTLFKQDTQLMTLPPGIQDIICSFYSSRFSNDKVIYSCSTTLQVPRDYLTTQVSPQLSSSVEYSRSANIWSLVRQQLDAHLDADSLMGNLENSTLFYAYYFTMTPYEASLAERELLKRQWRSDLSKINWFQRLPGGETKQGPGFEISSYKKFDAITWSMIELLNYKLDYNGLSA